MKKLLALIFVALCTISIEAQEKYVAIERNAETGVMTMSEEFKAVLPMNEDGTYGDVATNKDERGSVVVMKTASVTVEAVGGSTPAEVPDVAGDNTATHFDINADGTVNSWSEIKWQQKSQRDINWAWIQGTGNPAAKIEAEAIMTDDMPATYFDENGVEHTKYRPKYTFYEPDGSLGVPEMGLHYKFTATAAGSIKIGTWVNKGNRKTYVVDAATALPIAYLAEGYINGQNHKILPEGATDSVSVKKYLSTEEIDSIHKANCTDATTGEDTKPYVIGAGNQPFFGYITFEMEAGKTYYVFCVNTQLGFNGWIFDKYITFADSKVKALCVANWDTNSDGELSYAEAAAVTSIGQVFNRNKEITSFNELQYFTGLTSIGNNAFSGCSGLTSVSIPSSVTSIGICAFYGCSGLTGISIPSSVTSIGNSAFDGCSGLTTITVDADNPVYDSRNNCNAIIETSTNKLLYGCKNTVIPGSVTSIGYSAFSGCFCLTSISIPGSVTSIGDHAFSGCSGLTGISIPSSVTSIGICAFSGCTGLTTITVDADNPVYDSRNNCNAIIETATNGLIFGCKNTTIPSSVTSIGNCAFYDCYGLTGISIPNSVTSIGNDAFLHCTRLTSVSIPSSVTSIGDHAFFSCSGLTSVTCKSSTPPSLGGRSVFSGTPTSTLYVPAGSKAAYEAASVWNEFKEIIEIINITFADSKVKEICIVNWDTNGDGELSYAEAAAVTSIGDAFKNNTDIVSLDVLQYFTGLDSISRYAFYGCTNLASVIIPESVDSIFPHAFRDCPSLTSLNIPANVKYINDSAIRNTGITELTVDENNTIYDSRNNCNAVIETSTNTLIVGCNSTVIPDNIVAIGAKAFHSNSFITSIELPNSVTSIQNDVFNGCTSLTEIIIPSGVTDIGSNAFKGCTNLVSVTSLAVTPPVAEIDAFNNINSDATLHVPSVSIEEYRKTEPWSNFGSIVALKDGQNNRFIVNDMDVLAGQSFVFPVGMINEIEVTAFQCDVYLPEGITLQTKKGKYDITLDENRKDDHTVTSALQEDGTVRIIVASLNNSIFSETSGILFNLNLIVAEGISATLPITIKNIHISDTSGKETILGDVTANLNVVAYTPGDVNNDGLILVNDVVTAINYILNVTPENFVFAAADMDSNGQILVNDVVQIINTILGVSSAKEYGVRAAVTQNADKFYMDGFTIKAGESKQVAIKFDTENINPADPSELNYVAFQFDLCLPQGLTVAKKKNKYDFKFNEDRMDDHTFTSSLQEDGSIRVVATSFSNASFWEKSGDFILFTVTASDNFTGNHTITLKNINFSDKSGEIYNLPDAISEVTDGVVNGISGLDASNNKAMKIYTIDGKCVMKSAIKNGIYIVNGKKFYVK